MKTLELTLLYLIKSDQVLLAMKKRGFGQGKWNGVGGKIEASETVEQALVRECQEEINVVPTEFSKSGYLVFNEHHDGVRKLMNLHVYTATKWQGVVAESDEMKPEWFSIDQLPLSDMWPADSIWLRMVLGGQKIRGKFTLNEDNSVAESTIQKVGSL